MGRGLWRRLTLFWTLIVCGVVVPSFLYIPNTVTGHIDFSMKIATLIAVAAAPFAYAGLEQCRKDWRSPAAMIATAFVVLGLACTATYAGQFALLRLQHNHDRAMALPSDYVSALKFIRDNTPADAVVIDPQSVPFSLAIPTVLIGERRVYLPTKYAEEVLPPVLAGTVRTRDFEQWFKGGFRDRTLSARFASEANYCLLAGPGPADDDWTLIRAFGVYSVWKSNTSQRHRET
jgi:hypothetical protein